MTAVTHRPPAVSDAHRRAEQRAAGALRRAWSAAPVAERLRLARELLAGAVSLRDTEERSPDGHTHSVRCRECLRLWARGREGAEVDGRAAEGPR